MTSETGSSKSRAEKPSRVWILAGLLVAASGFAIMTVAGARSGVSETATAREDSIPYVETARVASAGHTYEVSAPGRLRARDSLSLVGEVSGKVTALNPALEVGGRIAKGETILKIDDGDFRADLARARAQLSTAKARLQQAEAEKTASGKKRKK